MRNAKGGEAKKQKFSCLQWSLSVDCHGKSPFISVPPLSGLSSRSLSFKRFDKRQKNFIVQRK